VWWKPHKSCVASNHTNLVWPQTTQILCGFKPHNNLCGFPIKFVRFLKMCVVFFQNCTKNRTECSSGLSHTNFVCFPRYHTSSVWTNLFLVFSTTLKDVSVKTILYSKDALAWCISLSQVTGRLGVQICFPPNFF
jgi:hypothetical protein